jgi:hypothetical protein
MIQRQGRLYQINIVRPKLPETGLYRSMQALGAVSGEVSNDFLASLVGTVVAGVLCGDDLEPSRQPLYAEYALWRTRVTNLADLGCRASLPTLLPTTDIQSVSI